MKDKALDAGRTRAASQQTDSIARGWKRWWPIFEAQWKTVNERLISLARIEPGERVLDLATGIGEPALTIAAQVGPKGSVVATEQAPQLLALARERKGGLGLDNVDFLLTDPETPNLPRGIFDAIVCRWGLAFLLDPRQALARYRDLLKPIGHLAAAVWGKPAQVPFMSIPSSAAQEVLHLPSPAPETPSVFGLTPQALVEAMAVAGFREIASESMVVPMVFASRREFAAHLRDVSAPLAAALAAAPGKKRSAFWKRVDELLTPFVQPDGTLLLPNTTVFVAGHR